MPSKARFCCLSHPTSLALFQFFQDKFSHNSQIMKAFLILGSRSWNTSSNSSPSIITAFNCLIAAPLNCGSTSSTGTLPLITSLGLRLLVLLSEHDREVVHAVERGRVAVTERCSVSEHDREVVHTVERGRQSPQLRKSVEAHQTNTSRGDGFSLDGPLCLVSKSKTYLGTSYLQLPN